VGDAARASLLLVDDSEAELQALELLLAPLGHCLLRAYSGEEALALLTRHDVACILLDVHMTRLDGFDVARLLESQSRAHVPLLLLTELSRGEASLIRSYSRGSVDYVLKPYQPEALRAQVLALLAAHAHERTQGLVPLPPARDTYAEVERQRDRLHAFLMQSPAIINIFRGPEHTFDFVNTQFLQVLGERAFLGRTVREAQPELEGQGIYELLDRVYQSGEPFRGETLPVHISPEPGQPVQERFYTFTYQPLRSPQGDVRGVGSFAFDVTEQVRARQHQERLMRELAHHQAQQRAIIEGVQEHAIFLISPEGIIESWNPGVERVKGYKAEEFIGQPFSMLFLEEQRRAGMPAEELRDAARRGSFKGEGVRRRKDGSHFEADIVLQALRGEDGALRGFVKVVRDVSQRKRAEIERERLLAELGEAVRLRDGFLSVASHELKTPLTPLRLKLERLAHAPAPDASANDVLSVSRKDLDVMRRQVTRLTNLVNDMLEITHVGTGHLPLKREPVDLGQLVRERLARAAPDALRLGCALELIAPDTLVGPWDRERLGQVIERLLSNALKYGAGKPVQVRLEHEAGLARLIVRDQGIGFDPTLSLRIFDKFERANSDRHYGGLGLGLYFSRSIVQGLGGRIRAEGAPGEGATFTVELPL